MTEAQASVTTSKEFQYSIVFLQWSNKRLSVTYPVCGRHATVCRLLDAPARWGFIDASLYLLMFPTLLWVASLFVFAVVTGIKGESLEPYTLAAGVLFFGAAIMYYILAATVKPVRLSRLKKNSVVISIRDAAYFNAFKLMNFDDPSSKEAKSFCSQCGAAVDTSARFCSKCGTAVRQNSSQ